MIDPVLDLPRLILRRAAWVALAALLAAAGFGWTSAATDIEEEVTGAQALVELLRQLSTAQSVDAAALVHLQQGSRLRHLNLSVQDAAGRSVFVSPLAPPASAPMRWWLETHRRWQGLVEPPALRWTVPRPEGAWTVVAHVSAEAERREALADLARLLAVLAIGLVALWLALLLGLRRAFAPMTQLLQAIGTLATQGATPLRRLPPMPIRELAAIHEALQRLAADLDRLEEERRLLSQKVQSVQEEERVRLARELHDEMGQRLTALRVDIAWLLRQPMEATQQAVVRSMSERCNEVQQDLRGVLNSLRPLGTAGEADEPIPLERVLQMIEHLVASWCAGAAAQDRQVLQPSFETAQGDGDGDNDGDTPLSEALVQRLQLPASLALALYRLSQEGLTNVARHAQARRATLKLTVLQRDGQVHGLDWSLTDDGVGLPAGADVLHRGNGLGGMQERVWALGGEWRVAPVAAGARPGLRLSARLPWSAGVVT